MTAIEEGREYSIGERDWDYLIINTGTVVEALVTGIFTDEPDLWAGFLVVESGMVAADASLHLRVRSLGCSDAEVTKTLSSAFNRKEGFLHLCHEKECPGLQAEDGDAHITRLRVFTVQGFAKPYMTAYTRTQIKKWLAQSEEGLPDEEEVMDDEKPDEAESREPPKRPRRGALRRPASASLDGRPKVAARPKVATEEERRKDLRKRLTAARVKMLGRHGSALPSSAVLHVRGEGEELDTISVGSSSSGYSPSPLDPALTSGTMMKAEPREKRKTQDLASQSAALAVMPFQDRATQKVKKKKKRKKEREVEARALVKTGDLGTRGGTTSSLQSKLIQRAAEVTQAQKEKKREQSRKEDKTNPGRQLVKILTNFGKKAKKKDNSLGPQKGRKRKKAKPDPDGDPDKESSSSQTANGDSNYSDSSGSSAEDSEEKKMEAPLRRRSHRHPGSVLQMLVTHAKSQLDQTSKVDVPASVAVDATQGVRLASYFAIVVRPTLGTALAVTREMHHLANALDLLRQGELSRLGDVLAGRFMSLHQSVIDGGWGAARHLEVMPMEDVSAAGSSVVLQARRHARLQAKALGVETTGGWRSAQKGKAGGKGKNPSWGDGEWSGGGRGKGKSAKGKGKGKSGWTGPSQEGDADYNKKKEKPGEK